MSMNTCSLLRQQIRIVLCLALLALPSICNAAELKPEDVIARHLDSIGNAEARKRVKSRVVQGTAQYKILVGGAGTLDGKAVMVSEGDKMRLLLKFENNDYKGEQFVSDGNRLEVAATTAQRNRSPLGDYIYTQNTAVHEGLFGGVLSTAWPLLDLDERKPKLSYEGLKTVDGHQAYMLRYKPKKGSDQSIELYFDQETYRHVLTVYTLTIHPHLGEGTAYQSAGGSNVPVQMTQTSSLDQLKGSTPDNPEPGSSANQSPEQAQARQQDTRYRIEERFSDLKTADGLTMPTHYDIHFSRELQNGATSVYEWDVKIGDINENVSLDPKNFQPK
jgi:outer membrane lipoprotein-sorting protein